ncbi:MAG: hypothetical protein IJT58_07810 [Synergistaceae bacterium]|nr:hypothetical protein [Synergistaceae bacterium]
MAARCEKGSSNFFKAVMLLRKAYQKLDNKKRNAANKIVHELADILKSKIYMLHEI